MSCALVYNGTRYVLDKRYNVHTVTGSITQRMNRVAHTRDNLAARPVEVEGGVGLELSNGEDWDFEPWLVFHLAGGGDVWILVNDELDLLVETTEQTIQTSDTTGIYGDPLAE